MELEHAEVDEQGEVIDKPYEAHRLRKSGMTWRVIAKRLGYSNETAAYRASQIYLQQYAMQMSKQRREEMFNLQMERLEELLHTHWQAALLGDIDSANFCLKALDQMNKLGALYEGEKSETVKQFIVIANDKQGYAAQLRELVEKSDTKEITVQDMTDTDVREPE
jgi:hypothetical protein